MTDKAMAFLWRSKRTIRELDRLIDCALLAEADKGGDANAVGAGAPGVDDSHLRVHGLDDSSGAGRHEGGDRGAGVMDLQERRTAMKKGEIELLRYVRMSWIAVFMAAAVLMAVGATLYYNPDLMSTRTDAPDHYSQ